MVRRAGEGRANVWRRRARSSAKQIPPPPSPPWDFRVRVRVRKRGVLFRGFGSGFAIPLRPFSEVLAEQSSDKKLVKYRPPTTALLLKLTPLRACWYPPYSAWKDRLNNAAQQSQAGIACRSQARKTHPTPPPPTNHSIHQIEKGTPTGKQQCEEPTFDVLSKRKRTYG